MRKLILIIFIIAFTKDVFTQNPFSPTTTATRISGTIGERRGPNAGMRYHRGVDFSTEPNIGTGNGDAVNVQATTASTIFLSNGAPAVGHFGYIHVTASAAFYMMPATMAIPLGFTIGPVNAADAHIHLQRSSMLIHTMTPPPTAWEDDRFELNHLVGIGNGFSDLGLRDIEDIGLYRDGSISTAVPAGTNITTEMNIFGKIDVLLDAEDYGINGNGLIYNPTIGSGKRLAYRIADFKVKDNNTTELFNSDDINFDECPKDLSGPTCFHPTLSSSSNWAFFLTHDPNNTPYDKYWNSRQSNQANSTYINTTDIPVNAEYQDGTNIYFEGRVEDYGGHSDTRTLPLPAGTATVPTNFYTIDNFWPYITSVSVSQDGIPIANLNRLSSEGGLGTENNGNILVNNSRGFSFDNVPNSTIELVVTFSESMEDVDFSVFDPFGQVTQILTSGMTDIDADRKIWEGSFTMNIDAEQELQLEFTGSDRAGHEIMDIHQLTNSNSPGIINLIPTRTDVTATNTNGWHNFPDAYGSDAMDLKFGCFGPSITDNSDDPNRSSINSNCQFILNPSFNVTDVSCSSKGSITLNYEGNGIPFDILEFSNSEGDMVGSGNVIIKNLDPGIYTYLIVYECCVAEGSVEILGVEQPIYTATFAEGISPKGGVDIFLEIDIPEGLGSVSMVITNVNTGFPVCGKLWDSGQVVNTECFGLTPGDEYCIEFRWGEGCSLEDCFIAEGDLCPNDLYVFESFIEPACADAANGTILLDIESSNCDSPNILWSTGQTSDFIEGLSPGVYSVTISAICNGVSCDSYGSYEVPVLPLNTAECLCPPIEIETIVNDICIVPTNPIIDDDGNVVYIGQTQQNGSISINIVQGGGGYTYIWDDGDESGAYRDINSPGDYCVDIFDSCGSELLDICFTIDRIKSPFGYCFTNNFVDFSEAQSGFVEIAGNWDDLPETIDLNESYTIERDLFNTNKARYIFKENGLSLNKGVLIVSKVQNNNSFNSDISAEIATQSTVGAKVKLYPNPFINDIYLEFESELDQIVRLSVYDLNGKQVKETANLNLVEGANKFRIQDVSHLTDGLYIVELVTESWRKSIQVVKMDN